MRTSMRQPLSLRSQARSTLLKGLMRPTLEALPTVWELAWKKGVGLQRLMKRVV